MIDVQIVAGKKSDVLAECLRRVLDQSDSIQEVFVGNRTGEPLDFEGATEVTLQAGTFEQNHNRLAAMGSSPFVLFLDDDAFLFEGAIETLLAKIQSDKAVAAVGGVNNQTFPVEAAPMIGSLEDFHARAPACSAVASHLLRAQTDVWALRIFLPGNCLLVRRRVWQREYGGWDEQYRNWNEEVDFTAWCFERGYRALCTPSVWFYHCQGQSRTRTGLREDIVASAIRFAEKWPQDRVAALAKQLQRQGDHRLLAELRILVENNARHQNLELVETSEYVRAMDRVLGA